MEGREERLGDLALDSVREQIGELLMALLNLDLNMPIYRARLSIPRWVDYTADLDNRATKAGENATTTVTSAIILSPGFSYSGNGA
ncbi:hypothetical protein SDJN03_18684, partial [Cucurbita argyrosperma subsp. sororia]